MTHPPGLYLDSGEFIPAEELNRRMRKPEPTPQPLTKADWKYIGAVSLIVLGLIGSLFFAAWGSV